MALECVVKVAGNCSSEAVLAWRVTQFRVPCAVHLSRSNLCVPLCLLKLVRTHDNMNRKEKKESLTIFIPMILACTVPSAYSSAVPKAAALLNPIKAEPRTDNEET
jgi:hypothetical protein